MRPQHPSTHYGSGGTLSIARRYNPFTSSRRGAKTLNALTLPLFAAHLPRGWGVLTTTGRRSGKRRRTCIRAILDAEQGRVYIVMIRPQAHTPVSRWVLNMRADPKVHLRTARGRYTGVARELSGSEELASAKQVYMAEVNLFDYAACRFHRPGLPSRLRIRELLDTWFETGIPLVVELDG